MSLQEVEVAQDGLSLNSPWPLAGLLTLGKLLHPLTLNIHMRNGSTNNPYYFLTLY